MSEAGLQDPDPDRREPRHRPCHGEALQPGGLAHHHLQSRGCAGRMPARSELEPAYHRRPRRSARRSSTFVAEANAALAGGAAPRAGQQCGGLAQDGLQGASRHPERRRSMPGAEVFQLNFFAPLALARGFAPPLHRGQGTIVNITSIAGHAIHPFAGSAYSTSKAALSALTREMAVEFAARRAGQCGGAGRDRDRDGRPGIREPDPAHPDAPHGHARGSRGRRVPALAAAISAMSPARRSSSPAASTCSEGRRLSRRR